MKFTLGDIREMTGDLPDETLIEMVISTAADDEEEGGDLTGISDDDLEAIEMLAYPSENGRPPEMKLLLRMRRLAAGKLLLAARYVAVREEMRVMAGELSRIADEHQQPGKSATTG